MNTTFLSLPWKENISKKIALTYIFFHLIYLPKNFALNCL